MSVTSSDRRLPSTESVRPADADKASTPLGSDHGKGDAELAGPKVVHDAVFGELSGTGPNYRNVSPAACGA